jgi:VIT1/CCC1 family predicted Fe2+/Mn2+ transporter
MTVAIDDELRRRLLVYQRNEITEHHIYRALAETVDAENRQVLERLAQTELRHYGVWRRYTGIDVGPNRWTIRGYRWLSRALGFTFGVRLLERWEQRDQRCYEALGNRIPEAQSIRADECGHEAALIEMLDERSLRYSGALVLGLSDAVVELTGALAGLTFALQDARLVALAALTTGIAAAMSMSASEYLSTKAENHGLDPLRAASYTGSAYLVTVLCLVAPFVLLASPFVALGSSLFAALAIIALFNFYMAIARNQPFKRHFLEMAGLSLAIAGVSFGLGLAIRALLGVEV